jgi:site-specific DNA-methyltransferase (adenine-specific)
MTVKQQPFKVHENIAVFSKSPASYTKKGWMKYNPQMTDGEPYKIVAGKKNHVYHSTGKNKTEGLEGYETRNEGKRYPRSVLKFSEERGLHPTQKPVALFEYLIRTYTNEGEIVLDNCMGSGTTAVAAVRNGRQFIGFETEPAYVEIANKRLDNEREAI